MLQLGFLYKTVFGSLVRILKNRQTRKYEVWLFHRSEDSSQSGWCCAFDGSLADCRHWASGLVSHEEGGV